MSPRARPLALALAALLLAALAPAALAGTQRIAPQTPNPRRPGGACMRLICRPPHHHPLALTQTPPRARASGATCKYKYPDRGIYSAGATWRLAKS